MIRAIRILLGAFSLVALARWYFGNPTMPPDKRRGMAWGQDTKASADSSWGILGDDGTDVQEDTGLQNSTKRNDLAKVQKNHC